MVLIDSDLFVFGARVANFWDMDMEEVSLCSSHVGSPNKRSRLTVL